MPKKKTVTVEIKKTKHKGNQVFTCRIEGGKTDLILSQRYTRRSSAKRGATRKLGGYVKRVWDGLTDRYHIMGYFMQDGREIVFINKGK